MNKQKKEQKNNSIPVRNSVVEIGELLDLESDLEYVVGGNGAAYGEEDRVTLKRHPNVSRDGKPDATAFTVTFDVFY